MARRMSRARRELPRAECGCRRPREASRARFLRALLSAARRGRSGSPCFFGARRALMPLVPSMFPFLGKIVARLWPLALAAWIVLLAGTWLDAPAWDDVTLGGDVNFLPEDALSRRGEELFKQAFPEEYFASSVVVIAFREGGALGDADKKFIDQVLTPALKKLAAQETGAARGERIIARIRAPGDKGVGALLLSSDKQAALVLVEFTTRYNDKRNWPTIAQIEEL